MSDRHARLRLLVAISQALSLSALAAAVTPLFLGRPAPLGLTALLMTASVALGLSVGLWPRAGGDPAVAARLRAALMTAIWIVVATLLPVARWAPEPLAFVWGVVGVTAALAAFAAARLDGEDVARSLAARSALTALAAGVAGAVLGRGLLPGPAALAVVALIVAAIVHAVARAHYRAVDPDRVSRSAAAVVAVIAVLALLLAIGPVHDAVAVALGAAWTVVAYALTIVAVGLGYFMWAVILLVRRLIHPHPVRPTHQTVAAGRTIVHPQHLIHPSPFEQHLGPFLLLLVAAAVAVWLAGRVLRRRPEADETLFRDEILDPRALGRSRRTGARRRPPAEGLARTYAQALSVLAAAQDSRAHPRPADTPAAVAGRATATLDPDSPALALFRRLTAAYAEWHYGLGPNRLPDAPARLLRLMREALPAARRHRGPRP